MKVKPILKTEFVIKGLKISPERYHNLIPLNEDAIKREWKSSERLKSEVLGSVARVAGAPSCGPAV